MSLATTTANGHHAFASVFDRTKPIDLRGAVSRVEWMNPHVWFYLDVQSEDGEVENWGFEMGSPNTLSRRGWSHDSLHVGDLVEVSGFQARDNTRRVAVRIATLTTGERLFGAQDATAAGSSVK